MFKPAISCSVTALFAIAALTLVGCAADAGSDVASGNADLTSATCIGAAEARATFDREAQAAQDKLQADYAAAMAQDKADQATAAATRDAALAALPNDGAADQANAIIEQYDQAVGAGGSIERMYDVNVKAAQDRFNGSVKAATDEYNRTICH